MPSKLRFKVGDKVRFVTDVDARYKSKTWTIAESFGSWGWDYKFKETQAAIYSDEQEPVHANDAELELYVTIEGFEV